MGPRSYSQACSVARALDLVGERWTLLIVRDLLTGPQGYGGLLAGLPGLTTNLLAKRLKDLGEAGLVERVPAPDDPGAKAHYRLTKAGLGLTPAIRALAEWGTEHARPVCPTDRLNHRLLLLVLARHHVPAEPGAPRWIVDLASPEGRLQLRLGGARFEGLVGSPLTADLTLSAEIPAWYRLLFEGAPAEELVAAGALLLEPGTDGTADPQVILTDFLTTFQLAPVVGRT